MGRDADEADVDEIIDMASKAPIADQQTQVQENIHLQIKSFCMSMDDVLLPDVKKIDEGIDSPEQANAAPRQSGLSFAIGRNSPPVKHNGRFFSIPFGNLILSVSSNFSEVLIKSINLHLSPFRVSVTFRLP